MVSLTARTNIVPPPWAAGVAFGQELRRVMVHGLLHLTGYGDKSGEEEKLMRAKEDHYLDQK